MLEEEEWREVKGFPDYLVSSFGRVLSKFTNKIRKPTQQSSGYYLIGLSRGGKQISRLLHRIVAENFIGDIEGLEINHKNLDKSDNRARNLEIVTSSANKKHFVSTNLKWSKFRKDNPHLISPSGEVHKVPNICEFARIHGLDASTLVKVLNGKNSHHHGWKRYNVLS